MQYVMNVVAKDVIYVTVDGNVLWKTLANATNVTWGGN
jgi:hypothetical protein